MNINPMMNKAKFTFNSLSGKQKKTTIQARIKAGPIPNGKNLP